MKGIINFFFIFVILSGIAQASIFLTYSSTHNVIKDEKKQFYIEIENNNSFDIYNVSFTKPQYFQTQSNINLSAFQKVNASINITATDIFNLQSFASIFSFTTKTTGVAERKQVEISINLTSLSNNNAQILKNDGIRFFNNGTENLTIKKNDSTLFFLLNAGEFFDINFTTVEEIGYFIEESGFIGKIKVSDNIVEQFIHDPDFDQTLTFSVSSANKPSLFTLQAPLNNFVMNFNSTTEGVLILESNETIFDVRLNSSKWIEFSENDFDFEERKIVNFKIKPKVNATNETGVVHAIEISAGANNANGLSILLNVFINKEEFAGFSGSNNTINFVFADAEAITAFCKANPQKCLYDEVIAAYCRVNPDICPKQEVLRNRSATDEGKLLEEIDSKADRALNRMVTIQQEQFPEMMNRLNTLEESQKAIDDEKAKEREVMAEEERKASRNRGLRWFFGIVLTVIGGIVLFILYTKYQIGWRRPSI